MRTIKQIEKKVLKLKLKLSNEKTLYEDFGDKEIRELDLYIDMIYDYNYSDRQKIVDIKNEFFDWCSTYTK